MSIIDRIQAGRRAFAEGPSKAPKLNSELGGGGDYQSFYRNEEARTDATDINTYRRMLDNDGTVEGLYKLITLPVKAATYTFSVEEGEAGAEELKLVEENFTLPPMRGGMSLPFDLFIADLLRSLVDGYRLFEKVFTLNDQGKIVYRKLAPRDPLTLTLLRDGSGGFMGARQRWLNGMSYKEVDIPTERCFLFTYGKEFSFLNGRSALKPMYYHYDKKHKLYHLDLLSAQVNAIKPRKLKTPESPDASTLAAAENAADRLGMAQRITLPEGWDIQEYDAKPLDVQKSIDHHNLEMARSFLAQFLMLGDGKTGSFALSKDQSEMFLLALQGLMKQIEQHINSYLIPDLINYNFGSGIYPQFKFEDLSDERRTILKSAYEAILGRADLPPAVIAGVAKELAIELGLDEDIDLAPGDTPDDKEDLGDKKASRQLAEKQYGRELTAAESRVNLTDMQRRIDTSVDRLFEEASTLFGQIKDEAVNSLRIMLKKGKLSELATFDLPRFNQYRLLLEQAMMEQYLSAKRAAADELGVKIPQTPATTKTYIKTQAEMVASKQKQDLIFTIKAEITKELRTVKFSTRDLGVVDILARIATSFTSYLTSKVSLSTDLAIMGAVNIGRRDVFESAPSEVATMEFSAVLDGRTSPLCRSLDGNTVSYEQYLATQWKPPLHFNCRSIWVAYKKDDSFIPDVTGMKPPAGVTEPLLHDHADTIDLSESIAKLDGIFQEVESLHATQQKNKVDAKKLAELEERLTHIED